MTRSTKKRLNTQQIQNIGDKIMEDIITDIEKRLEKLDQDKTPQKEYCKNPNNICPVCYCDRFNTDLVLLCQNPLCPFDT
jgi:hypothetical protein